MAVGGLPLSSNRQINRSIFLAVRSYGGVHSPFGQLPCLGKMTAIRLGIGCERQSCVLFGLACIPVLLFRHRGGIRPEKGESVESIVQYEIIHFARLRLVDRLPRLVEALQGKGIVGGIRVPTYSIRRETHGLHTRLRGFLIMSLEGEHHTQPVIRGGFPWVVRNPLLICLGCFIQLSGYGVIVVGGDLDRKSTR